MATDGHAMILYDYVIHDNYASVDYILKHFMIHVLHGIITTSNEYGAQHEPRIAHVLY